MKIQLSDQVYSNTGVPTQVNTSQHESTPVNTNKHKFDPSIDELKWVRQESARANTSQLDQ